MKILHVADIHYRNDLLEEISKCIDFVLETAERILPDAVVIAGDVFDERQTYDSPAFLSAAGFIRRLSKCAPVLIVKGTPSHDGHTLEFFQNGRVYVAEKPEQVVLTERGFSLFEGTLSRDTAALFSCLPSVSKAHVVTALGGGLTDTTLNTVDLLRDVLRGWGEVNTEARGSGVPAVLAGHLSVTGATLSTGQQMVGREVELGVGDLRMAKANLVCLGHIHKVQGWGEILYSGSITRLNFGEVEDKGFWLHTLEADTRSSEFVKTPARNMVTVDFDGLPSPEAAPEVPEGAFVRVRYEVSEEEVHCVDENALKDRFASCGAVDVRIEKTVVPKQRIRAEGISRLASLENKLRKWAETTGTEVPAGVFEKLALLEREEEPCDRCFQLAADAV